MDMSFTDLDYYYYYYYYYHYHYHYHHHHHHPNNMVVAFISREDMICSCRQCAVACEAHLTLHVTQFLQHNG
jgi:hypothetical protein